VLDLSADAGRRGCAVDLPRQFVPPIISTGMALSSWAAAGHCAACVWLQNARVRRQAYRHQGRPCPHAGNRLLPKGAAGNPHLLPRPAHQGVQSLLPSLLLYVPLGQPPGLLKGGRQAGTSQAARQGNPFNASWENN